MKRILSILMVITMAFVFAACQPTPETPIVVQKDIDRMVEKAETVGLQAELSSTVPLEAPSTYQYTGRNDKGNLTIEIDAQVVIPNVAGIPIVRVKAADFSQETVQMLFDALCEGEEMIDTTQRLTKAELEEEILGDIRLRDSEHYADDPDGQAQINDSIAAAQREYETAPETKEKVVVDGTLYIIPVIDPKGNRVSEFLGIEARNEEKGMNFAVENNNGLKEPIIYEYGSGWSGVAAGSGAVILFSKWDYSLPYDGRWYAEPVIPIADENTVPPEALGRLTITPAQARAELSRLLEGTDMSIRAISLATDYYDWSDDPSFTRATANYGYHLICTRTVQDVPLAVTSANTNGDDRYAASWGYEFLEVLITDAGIVNFYWRSPHTVTETVVDRAQLLPFEEIAAIAEKMLTVSYPRTIPGTTIAHTIRITRIELALQRVSEQNNVSNGLYVPTWSYYGTIRNEFADGHYSDTAEAGYSQFPECLLTINAVDGSIIDLNKGY